MYGCVIASDRDQCLGYALVKTHTIVVTEFPRRLITVRDNFLKAS